MKRLVLLAGSVGSIFIIACSAAPDGSSGADLSSAGCTPAECGPEPEVPIQKCADGKVAGPECVPTGKNTCGWIITHCPPTIAAPEPVSICTATECGPMPELLEKCADGKVLGPVCEKESTDKCEWVLPHCPDTAVTF